MRVNRGVFVLQMVKLLRGWSKLHSEALYSIFFICNIYRDRLCGLVVRVLGYRFGGPGSIPGTTRKKK
jgi:hypothetical protein